jgi:hypothetical protein
MDSSMIAVIGVVLSLVGAVVGSFAYLMGEIRKVGISAKRDLENVRDYLNDRIESSQQHAASERAALRTEFVQSTGRVETDIRRLTESMVRRADVDALESRLTRSTERLEAKFDTLITRNNRAGSPHNNP